MRIALIAVVALSFPASAGAEKKDDFRVQLLASGGEFDYQTRTIELPYARYGKIALHDYGERGASSRPPVLEAHPAAPAGWPHQSLAQSEGSRHGRARFAGRRPGERCRCATEIGDAERQRVAALYATTVFEVGTDTLEGMQLLELRARFRDGLIAYVNGREIARRNLGDSQREVARGIKGPEWERFTIPIESTNLRPGRNLLAIEVRPSKHRQAPALDAELGLLRAGAIVRGPLVQRVSELSATLVFTTDLPTEAVVEYGGDPGLGKRVRSAAGALVRRHRVRLTGLRAGSPVHYRVVVGGQAGATHLFHTPPGQGEPLRFAVYGDMRGGHRVHAKIVEALLDEAVDFVIATGDLVLRGSDEGDWQRFFSVAKPLLARFPYYPVAGNHDLGKTGDERRRMNEIFALWPGPRDRPSFGHWHSFRVSGVHFVMLDSNSYEHEEQLRWVEADLQAARRAGVRAIFAAVHDGPYSRGLHRGNQYAAEHYAPLLRKYGVNMLFSGHDHLYQRGEVDGLPYIVSGGAGAPLYSVRCGVRGKRKCKHEDGMKHVARVHHYVLVTVFPSFVSVCPKRADRSPIEACIRYPLTQTAK